MRGSSLVLLGLVPFVTLTTGACAREQATAAAGASASASASAEVGALGETAAISSVKVDHGELDLRAPADAPKLAATVIAATVYKVANTESRKLGYVRLGGQVERDVEPVRGVGCKGSWYRVYPTGFMCTDEATTDLEDPLVRAAQKRAHLDHPLPYAYGFVRATAPQYLRLPTRAEQLKSELALEEHLAWYEQNRAEVQTVALGSNDVPLDARGMPGPQGRPRPGYRPSTEQSLNEVFGGGPGAGTIPFWLEGGRKIPNVSGFQVPAYAVFADRVRRKTGLSFVDAFEYDDQGFKRRFGVTVDLRLIPLTKVKPDTGPTFHGVELSAATPMPFAFVSRRSSKSWKLIKGKDLAQETGDLPHRVIVPLSGKARIKAGKRFYQSSRDAKTWLRADDIGIVVPPSQWPPEAEKGQKWIDVSLRQQTLVLWEGKRAVYATLVSTGRDGANDPKTTLSTPQGSFKLQSKHIAAMMDSNENSSVAGGTRAGSGSRLSATAQATARRLLEAEKAGQRLSEEDQRRLSNVKKGRDPEYGVTQRRGSSNFELRDVPWIQYFSAGYALHGAYWHDVFGVPRSHGCINLSPVDARVVFLWTDPPIPTGWHGINIGAEMGEGTTIVIHE